MSRRTIIGALVVALAIVGLIGWRASATSGRTTFSATFESTVGLYPGSDVQILGVPVGTVTQVQPATKGVTVTMRLDGGQAAAYDTDAVIVAPTLVSDRFVQLTKPYTSGEKLAEDARIPMSRTATPVEIDDLYKSLTDVSEKLGPNGANKDGALSEAIDVVSDNLKGQGTDINQLITEFSKASGTLADSGDDLFATIANFKKFNDVLVANDSSVANVNKQFAEVNDYLADDSDDLAGAIRNLGEALAIVDDFIRDNRGNLTTSVKNLQGPTRVLVNQKQSLEESVRTIPLLLQNFLKTYDARSNSLTGRGNLNEISIWGKPGQANAAAKSSAQSSAQSSGSGSSGAPAPSLLPEANR